MINIFALRLTNNVSLVLQKLWLIEFKIINFFVFIFRKFCVKFKLKNIFCHIMLRFQPIYAVFTAIWVMRWSVSAIYCRPFGQSVGLWSSVDRLVVKVDRLLAFESVHYWTAAQRCVQLWEGVRRNKSVRTKYNYQQLIVGI